LAELPLSAVSGAQAASVPVTAQPPWAWLRLVSFDVTRCAVGTAKQAVKLWARNCVAVDSVETLVDGAFTGSPVCVALASGIGVGFSTVVSVRRPVAGSGTILTTSSTMSAVLPVPDAMAAVMLVL